MNILLLMAGSSDAFREAGHLYPKPLVEIAGRPMVQHIIEGQALVELGGKLIVAVSRNENAIHHIAAVINLLAPSAKIVEVPGETAGAACSALLAVDWVDDAESLVVVNGDQIIDADLGSVVNDFQSRGLDGGTVVFKDVHPRWSFVKCDADGLVIEAAEKRPISNMATAGFYYFHRGSDFVSAAETMILKGASVNGHFYVCPAYNELVLLNKKIGTFLIEKRQYISLASPRACEMSEREIYDN
jgi:dTDP-glucose pyrophosphorylase